MARIGRPPSCECGECKKCEARVRSREWYRRQSAEKRQEIITSRDPERVKANDRARHLRDKEKRNEAVRERSDRYTEKARKQKREWDERNPEKRKASTAVNNAIRDGRMSKEPCEICGVVTVEGHHDDYSQPLVVRWLCDLHHKEHHVRERGLPV